MWLLLAGLTTAGATEVGHSRPLGLGIQLGSFSGITGKFYLGGRRNALDFAVGTAYGRTFASGIQAQVSYHFHFDPLTEGNGVTIPWRVGVGGWINAGSSWVYPQFDDDRVIVGARTPLGLDFDLEEIPLQFYAEIAFNLAVVPGVGAGFDGSIGGRYYF